MRRAGSWLVATLAALTTAVVLTGLATMFPMAATPAGAADTAATTQGGVAVSGRPCGPGEGVTVIVDFTTMLDEIHVACAPGKQPHGFAALRAAGFRTSSEGGEGRICTIDGRPTQGYPYCWTTGGFWSHWNEGDSGAWEFSQVGAGHGPLAPGHVSGWSWAQDFRPAAPRIPARWAPPADDDGNDGSDDSHGTDGDGGGGSGSGEPGPIAAIPPGGADEPTPGGGTGGSGSTTSPASPQPGQAGGSDGDSPSASPDAVDSTPFASGDGGTSSGLGEMELASGADPAGGATAGGTVVGVAAGAGAIAVVGAVAALSARRRHTARGSGRTGVPPSSIR